MKRRLVAVAASLAMAGGIAAGVMAHAQASVMYGNHIEVGCSTNTNVLVYTVVDNNGAPTGSMDAIGWACGGINQGTLDLQNYVRVGTDQFGNVVVREYRTRTAAGTPIAIAVVPGWDKNHEH